MTTRRRTRRGGAAAAADFGGVAAVMALRVPLIYAEFLRSPPYGGAESALAASEKFDAALEGAFAAYRSLWFSGAQFWLNAAFGRNGKDEVLSAWKAASDAALQPAGRRVRANLRRLSGEGPRKSRKKR